jgi:hypothetical protein
VRPGRRGLASGASRPRRRGSAARVESREKSGGSREMVADRGRAFCWLGVRRSMGQRRATAADECPRRGFRGASRGRANGTDEDGLGGDWRRARDDP